MSNRNIDLTIWEQAELNRRARLRQARLEHLRELELAKTAKFAARKKPRARRSARAT